MENKYSKVWVALIVVGLIATAGYFFFMRSPQVESVERPVGSVSGPVGPMGPMGPAGSEGPVGPRGPAGSGTRTLGAVTGPDIYSRFSVHGPFTEGGLVLATSTGTSALSVTATVFKNSDLENYSVWQVTPNTGDLTYTFPASSTISVVPDVGDSRTWAIYNASTTATIDVIFAAGTGSAIKGAGGGTVTLDEDSFGTITLVRKANKDLLILTDFPTAD